VTKLHPGLTPLSSSMLAGHAYDPNTRTLSVQYMGKDGAPSSVWTYEAVPMERAEALSGSMSPGRYFNDKIKGLYTARQVK